jgi:acyl-CoA synthetase (AMP-forming)/AMP-acid ligase II
MAHVLQSTQEPELNYFVCTLGQAARINAQSPHVFKTVNDFIDFQARTIPQAPAVAFPIPPDSKNDGLEWQQRILSMLVSSRGLGIRDLICALAFEDLLQGSIAIGQVLSKSLQANTSPTKTVALLCPSSIDFLFAWLGLMRLGHSVLLIAYVSP